MSRDVPVTNTSADVLEKNTDKCASSNNASIDMSGIVVTRHVFVRDKVCLK